MVEWRGRSFQLFEIEVTQCDLACKFEFFFDEYDFEQNILKLVLFATNWEFIHIICSLTFIFQFLEWCGFSFF